VLATGDKVLVRCTTMRRGGLCATMEDSRCVRCSGELERARDCWPSCEVVGVAITTVRCVWARGSVGRGGCGCPAGAPRPRLEALLAVLPVRRAVWALETG